MEEDEILKEYITVHGKGRWNHIAKSTDLNRSGKSCRLRWMNYLCPDVKQGKFSEEEDDLIIRLHNLLGNRWALIAGRVPGRTDNQVKNHWNTHLSKKLRIREKMGNGPAASLTISRNDKQEGKSPTVSASGNSISEFSENERSGRVTAPQAEEGLQTETMPSYPQEPAMSEFCLSSYFWTPEGLDKAPVTAMASDNYDLNSSNFSGLLDGFSIDVAWINF